ncbi:MAG: RNA polymerase sigma factor (sigma-70 family) [Akkermansiaceae bacterium]
MIEAMEFVSQETKTMLSIMDDRELVLLARSGRQDAFVEIVARYQNLVAGVAFSILQDFAKSEDAAQESFVKAWKRMRDLREPEKLRPWLAQIARNSALNQLRKDHLGNSSTEDLELIEDPASRPDELMVQAEERATVLKALASLPEKYRLPLVLFYCDEKSIRAVAEALDLREDAVKQRLSRGRARLRERMTGLIDSVLGSARLGRSNALFTASVATAIGALTKSSALAAAAISTTTNQTTGTAFSTSLAMTSSKSTLSTVALLMAVSLPIGYSAHKLIEGDSTPTAVTQTAGLDAHSKSSIESYEISLKESQLVEEWRKLRAKYGDQHSDLLQLRAEITGIPNRIQRRAFTAILISEWAELHAAKGLPFFREKNRANWERDLFLHEMFRQDAEQAIDVLMASGDAWEEFAAKYLNEIAKQLPHRLAAVVARLPSRIRYLAIEDAFELYTQDDLDGARRAAEEVSGLNRPKAFAGIARAWAEQDGQAARAWAESIEEASLRESTVGAVLVGWARTDAFEALDQLASMPFKAGPSPAAMVLGEAADHDFDATMAWLRDNSDQLGSDAFSGLRRSFDQRLLADPAVFLTRLDESKILGQVMRTVKDSVNNYAGSSRSEIMDWLLTNETSAAKIELEEMVLTSLAFDQTATAMKIADGIADPEKQRNAIKTVVSGMINYGHLPHAADLIFETVSPSWKEAIVTGLFEEFRSENVPSFQRWAERMGHLPETHRISAHQTMGRGWAEIEPMNAVDWALARSEGAQRKAFEQWLEADLGSAADWLAAQESLQLQDELRPAVIKQWAKEDPDGAFQWTNTQLQGRHRTQAMKQFIHSVAANDRDLALQYFEKIAPGATGNEAAGVIAQSFFSYEVLFAATPGVDAQGIAWLESLKPDPLNTALEKINTFWAYGHPESFKTYLLSDSASSISDQQLGVAAGNLANKDPVAIMEWSENFPHQKQGVIAKSVLSSWFRNRPEDATKWFNKLPLTDERRPLLVKAYFEGFEYLNPAVAAGRLRMLPKEDWETLDQTRLTTEKIEKIKNLAER